MFVMMFGGYKSRSCNEQDVIKEDCECEKCKKEKE